MDDQQNEIINRWRELEDVEKEHRLFEAYLKIRGAYLGELKKVNHGESTRERARALKLDEQLAFDQYVHHRSKL